MFLIKNFSLSEFASILILLLALAHHSQAQAESEDREKFKRINRGDLQNRTPKDLGNQNSTRHPDMRIQSPQVSGDGCSPGNSSVVLTEDKRAISILFNDYTLAAGGIEGPRRLEKNCQILLPIIVPAGHKVTVVALDFRGFVALPQGAKASMQAFHRYYNQSHLPTSRRFVRQDQFSGPLEEEYILTSALKNKIHWSVCGQQLVLQIQTQLKLQSNAADEEALATLDSLDGQSDSDLTYHLLWERC